GLKAAAAGAPDQLRVGGLGGDLGGAEPGELLVHVCVGKHVQGTRAAREIFPLRCVKQFAYPPGRSPASHPERRRDRPCEASATIPATAGKGAKSGGIRGSRTM